MTSVTQVDAAEDPLGPEGDASATFDDAQFRSVLGHYATGVTVVSAIDPDTKAPIGLSVNSFTSASLDPPLVAFLAAKASSTWPRIREAGGFAVNVLADHQEAVSRRFATHSDDKYKGLNWSPSPSGAPILDGVLAWIDCTIEAEHDAGDHVLVIGRVHDLDLAADGAPLIFYRGGYGRIER